MDHDHNKEYQRWLECAEDAVIQSELKEIEGSEEEIRERFFGDLEFGTAGLRGKIGAGTYRMNIYTVSRATQGYSDYLNSCFEAPSVAVAYDSRRNNLLFSETAAAVFAGNGIHVHLYPELMPTPALSFAVRDLGCSGGVVVTASHNTAEYNGYKAYGPDGCQITPEAAGKIEDAIARTDIFTGIRSMEFGKALEAGLVTYIGSDTAERYLAAVSAGSLLPENIARDAAIVYTPLNGSGISCVPRCLAENGFTNIIIPDEQKDPDGEFPTCPKPNPEEKAALEVGIAWAGRENAELILATDPDCDRAGAAVLTGDGPRLITGNEMGVLLMEYICRMRTEQGRMPDRPIAFKTIVTTRMAADVAADHGVEMKDLLTGFKYIGEQIGLLEEKGEEDRYILGFEESYGYLTGSFVRDKDAVDACLMICEMFAYYKAQGRSLADVLDGLYEKYGYYKNTVKSFVYEGSAGIEKIKLLMEMFRNEQQSEAAGYKIDAKADYLSSVLTNADGTTERIELPESNVIRYYLEGGNEAVLRPSGTEPKLKLYVTTKGRSMEESAAAADSIIEYFSSRIEA